VRLGIFWLVIIAVVIFIMEEWEDMESKQVKGKGKKQIKKWKKNRTKKETKKVSKIKTGTVY
jgi:hypothetical protein